MRHECLCQEDDLQEVTTYYDYQALEGYDQGGKRKKNVTTNYDDDY